MRGKALSNMLHDGLYEQIINKGLDTELATTDKLSTTAPIDSAEASKVLAKYIAEVVEQGLDNVVDNGGDVSSQVALANRIISTIINETKENGFDEMSVAERAEQLLALFDKKNSILALDEKAQIIRPETSIAQSSLFTGAIHEPQMYTELKKEIVSCNRIDMLVSFIKWSGLRLIMDELTTFTQNGGELRIITTSYMGATDVKAIEELRTLILRLHDYYNVVNIIVTSDHGFLFQDLPIEDYSKHQIAEDTLERKTRYYLSASPAFAHGIAKFPLHAVSPMRSEQNIYVGVPCGTNRLAAPGGGYQFAHGGMALEEVIVPVVICRYQRKNDAKSKVGVSLVSPNLSVVSSNVSD